MGIRSSSSFAILWVLLIFLFWGFPGLASSSSNYGTKKLYIVYMGEKHHDDPDVVTSLHHDTLSSLLGSMEEALGSIVYSYKHGFSGFAAMLTDSQAKTLAGIWPESRSFNDEGYGPIPARWKGICQTGEEFNSSHCNRKIIGARWYAAGVPEETLKEEYRSPRDFNSHGIHVASTAAGSFVPNASDNGLAAGWARGGAPRARLAIYKVLWGRQNSGDTASILKAIDDATGDGVDVLNLSLGSGDSDDTWQFPTVHAIKKGVIVVYAGGNEGPYPQTVGNTSPWIITVAASSMDRSFPTAIILGDKQVLEGQALYFGNTEMDSMFTDIVFGSSCDEQSLNSSGISGKVVLCNPGQESSTDQILTGIDNVVKGGGPGVIIPVFNAGLIDEFKGVFPHIFVDWVVYQQILNYIAIYGEFAKVNLAPTRTMEGNSELAPRVADFSSRGPGIYSKGVRILAAVRDSYEFKSGTSMAAPHVAGLVALLKSIHPTWSPAAIKSAIMTAPSVDDNRGAPIVSEGIPRALANPFDNGSGHINPEKAADPGLVYDIVSKDFEQFNCSSIGIVICETPKIPLYHLNLPSIAIPDLKTKTTVSRTVTNVGSEFSTYDAIVESPPGVQMQVHPTKLVFDKHTKTQKFTLTFTPPRKVQGTYNFGSLTWKNEKYTVRIPITVRPVIKDLVSDIA